jgi:hypothetical protein
MKKKQQRKKKSRRGSYENRMITLAWEERTPRASLAVRATPSGRKFENRHERRVAARSAD